jgi:hypothetical protein
MPNLQAKAIAISSRQKNILEQIARRTTNPYRLVAIACEDPGQSERPVTHWTRKELADEAVKRGIVEQISPRSVGRFLKRGYLTTPSQSLLAIFLTSSFTFSTM